MSGTKCSNLQTVLQEVAVGLSAALEIEVYTLYEVVL